ncbi:tigger transposable element-derived protein 1-like [Palaemon carinicauda]|uniref:tigger transposable element-derived protein 1-like n=1 Tax=Palaemon carinicauda TaxID=392227 RepID=UPI0035B657CF
MALKRKADSSDGSASKKRKAITMEVKLDIIKRSKNGSAPMKATVITKQRKGLTIEMERLLVLWFEDQSQQCIQVSLIQEKAKRLFEALKKESGEGSESEEFSASRGWFVRCKARANYHNLNVQCEAVSGDEKAAS